jgi:transposase
MLIRLKRFEKFAKMLLRHEQGLLNYCHALVRFGVVEAVNGNIRALIRRGRGYTICGTYCSKRNGWQL